MTAILNVVGLTVGYGGVSILRDLNFSVPGGRITVILGKSGSGKSTLLKTLVGLQPPLAGSIEYFGQRWEAASEKTQRRLYDRIGILFQNGALLSSLSLYENVALPLRMHNRGLPVSVERRLVMTRLAQVGLEDSPDKFPSELSGGMRKRAGLARALIRDPDIIFCDEPSAGLDPITSGELDGLMRGLQRRLGKTLVVVTHELRSIENIADRVVVLHQERLHFQGEMGDLADSRDPFLRTFFLRTGENDIQGTEG